VRSGCIQLRSEDLDRIRRAQVALLSPLAHDDVDAWRTACVRAVRAAVGAQAGVFVLPGAGGPRFFSEEYRRGSADDYPIRMEEVLPDVWVRQARLGAHTEQDVWEPVLDTIYESAYYHECRVPWGALNAGGLTTLLSGEPTPDTCAQLLTHRGRDAEPQGDRERAIYGLLLPAFVSGCASVLDVGGPPTGLRGTLDALEAPTLLAELGGRELHRNQALSTLLGRDESGRLGRAIGLLLTRLGCMGDAPPVDAPWTMGVRLDDGESCRIRATLVEDHRPGPEALVLVSVDVPRPLPAGPGPWMHALGLTPRQAEVAVLLARGWSNKRVALELGIRPKTARRHTEAVLRALGVASRAAVARRLLSVE
jgi:DNA-binding CsgD family transcriptional regulator